MGLRLGAVCCPEMGSALQVYTPIGALEPKLHVTGASKQHALIYIYWRTKAPPTFFKSRLAVLGNAVWPLHDLRLGFDTEVNVFKALSFACFRKDLGFGV